VAVLSTKLGMCNWCRIVGMDMHFHWPTQVERAL
jgi:hypothetical protein